MATRNVTDTIRHSDGSVWAAATVTFKLIIGSYTGSDAYPRDPITATTSVSGVYTATLWCDEEGVQPTSYRVTYPDSAHFFIDLPVGDGSTVQMSALRTSVPGIPAVNLQTLLDAATFLQLADTPNTYVGQANKVVSVNAGETALSFTTSGASGAPTDATYITQTPNATLSAEQALSALASGYLKNTTGTGVLSVQAAPIPAADIASLPESQITNLTSDLAGKAASSHTHAEADVTSLTSDLALKAPLASPALTGTPTAPTASGGTNTTQLATTAFANAVTIPESQVTNLTSDLTLKAPLASPTFTGTPAAPTAAPGTNTTQVATTAFAAAIGAAAIPESQVTNLVSDLALKAPLASPALTGTPTAPTASGGTNTTQIATTAFANAVTIPESQVTNLVSDLSGKAASSHTHAEADVTSLVTDLGNKVAKNAANTWTSGGSSDMTSATSLIVPSSGGAAPTADGSLAYDTTQDSWKGGGAGALSGAFPRVINVQRSTTDTLSNGSASEQNFATTFTLPANFLIAGKLLRLTILCSSTVGSSPVSTNLRLKFGSTVLYAYGAVATPSPISTTRTWGVAWLICGSGAPGASVNVDTALIPSIHASSTSNSTAQPVAVATNASQVLTVSMQYGGTGGADSTTLRDFLLEELN